MNEDELSAHIRKTARRLAGESATQAVEASLRSLYDRGFPLLTDLHDLASVLEFNLEEVSRLVSASSRYYRRFALPKRRGGFREIAAPTPILYSAQRWITDSILAKIPINEAATAYSAGSTVIENAHRHRTSRTVLKMDLSDFFGTITINRVIAAFNHLGYLPRMSYFLASICCLDGRLPQGAATSPALSNVIAKGLDARLSAFAAKAGLNYTRYADDITLSGNDIRPNVIALVRTVAADEGFKVNELKTKLIRGGGKRIVTGISIAGGELKLPKDSKRAIRQQYHMILKNGLLHEIERTEPPDIFLLERVIGRLTFWKHVEPGNRFVAHAIERLKSIREI